jgi:hypothetical protein
MSHVAGSLPQLVENLVKNWEVEASFKPVLSDWRTVDHANYSFAINGSEPQGAENMLKVKLSVLTLPINKLTTTRSEPTTPSSPPTNTTTPPTATSPPHTRPSSA